MGNLAFNSIPVNASTRRQCSFTAWSNLCFHTGGDSQNSPFYCKAHQHKDLMQVLYHLHTVSLTLICVRKFSPEPNSCCLPLLDTVSKTEGLSLLAPYHRLLSLPRMGNNSGKLVISVDTEQCHDPHPTLQKSDPMDRKTKKKNQNSNQRETRKLDKSMTIDCFNKTFSIS